ncbi:25S rRNA (cytosine2278-C5)-methyltransferase [Nematocida homosporus]|uniref:25S rRNA (cytosine2278-C5)-methyltransferase n=1 Tax=Nematocida homosporus TaxID=1912981 RepID=UPI00221ED3AC|nr:25S rRNA (cytosine2278-C5)-methyltransferase [Nematocida homosporus]KAI5186377.1 25S rRNA (cytosine2278-C5)-methyltransferase [Nematocida homosporus]
METKKFYDRCGKMLKDIVEKRTGIKTACYKTEMPTKYMAVLSSILRRITVLERVVFGLQAEVRSKWMGMVLCHEILYGNRREALRFNRKMVQKVKDAYKALGLVEKTEERVKESVYIRINTLKATKESVSSLALKDTIIPDVYQVLERVNWSKLKSYQKGYFFVQDLSSCLPAYVLNPPAQSTVIDACAAPGNKTTHLSMLMGGEGKIFAIEKDTERFQTLREMIAKSGAENIVSINDDFLAIDRNQDKCILAATHILVDPSCSGSGLHPEEEKDLRRLSNLAGFQIKILSKALKFPVVKRVVYSTCSLFEEENEAVVKVVLQANPEFKLEKALPAWPHRGLPGYDFSDKVVRCPANEETRGFFLACFVRKS